MTVQTRRYYSAPGVRWVRERDRILVISPENGQVFSLRGTRAVTWDGLMLGHSARRIVRLIHNLTGLTQVAAIRELQTILEEWRIAGLLQVECESAQPTGSDNRG
jgi:hypothetical protein